MRRMLYLSEEIQETVLTALLRARFSAGRLEDLFGAGIFGPGSIAIATLSPATFILTLGTNSVWLNGRHLIGDSSNRSGSTSIAAVAFQLLDYAFVVVRSVILGKPGERLGQDVVVMYIFQTRFAGNVEP